MPSPLGSRGVIPCRAIRWQELRRRRSRAQDALYGGWGRILGGIPLHSIGAVVAYFSCVIEITTGKQAVLIRKTGLDLAENMEIAPAPE